ncbi:hypothetical protein NDU88_006426 [Pleurodeles waltl]|uniref:Uncharacterized protein n=1 Tax=Pleurodeles waltl TaxID=8319 RepID=A0AAV7WDG2_PLEWA|nr:hypothetical protein NDU88_006426 [Pleurodeles waltl]
MKNRYDTVKATKLRVFCPGDLLRIKKRLFVKKGDTGFRRDAMLCISIVYDVECKARGGRTVECGTGWTEARDQRLAVGVKDALWVAPV